MTPVLEIDLGNVPDEIVPFDKGTYLLRITAVPEITEKQTKGGGTGQMVTFHFTVAGDGDGNPCDASEQGRVCFSNLCLWTMMGKVAYKRLMKSCGLPVQGEVDLESFMGATCKAKIGTRTWHDDESDEDRTMNDIKSFIIPEDDGADEMPE